MNRPERTLKAVLMMTEENPVGREYLQACLQAGISLVALIVESSIFARKCLEYNLRRMGGLYCPPSTAELLEGHRIPVYLTTKHKSPYVRALLSELAPDVAVAGGVGGILRKDMLDIPRVGFIGCHPGLLPRMRGSNPIAYAILDDYPLGATCFLMDEGIDAGPIIYSEPLPIYRRYSYEMIEAAMLRHCGKVLAKGLQRIIQGDHEFEPQRPEDGNTHKQAPEEVLSDVRKKLEAGKYAHYSD